MSRTITQIQCEMQQDQFNQILNTYMTSEGFKLCLVKGEQVWKKGNGFITAPQFLKVIIWEIPFCFRLGLSMHGFLLFIQVKRTLMALMDLLLRRCCAQE